MRLRPVKRKRVVLTQPSPDPPAPAPAKKREKKPNTLPPDEYKPEFEPIRFLVREEPSRKDPAKVVRQYLELSVKRYNDDDGLPYLWCQMYQESEFYTGYLKGKTIYLPLTELDTLRDHLDEIANECELRGIE